MEKIKIKLCDDYIDEYFIPFLNDLKEIPIKEANLLICEDYQSKHIKNKKTIYIRSFSVFPQKSGYGTLAMQEICNIADKHKISLSLYPTNKSEFYKKFGFQSETSGYCTLNMFRFPK